MVLIIVDPKSYTHVIRKSEYIKGPSKKKKHTSFHLGAHTRLMGIDHTAEVFVGVKLTSREMERFCKKKKYLSPCDAVEGFNTDHGSGGPPIYVSPWNSVKSVDLAPPDEKAEEPIKWFLWCTNAENFTVLEYFLGVNRLAVDPKILVENIPDYVKSAFPKKEFKATDFKLWAIMRLS